MLRLKPSDRLPLDLRARRKELTKSTHPQPTPPVADEFGTLRPYMEFDKGGSFTGTITARNIGSDELIDLFASIMVKPGLVGTIKVLDLSNPDVKKTGLITVIPKLKGFTGLKVVNIAGQQLRSIHDGWLDDCPQLEEVYLQRNNITTLPETLFKNCKHLKLFNIHSNSLETFPAGLFKDCKMLEKISMGHNQLIEIFEGSLDDCTDLRELHVGSNQLKTIPAQLLRYCTCLEQLHMKENKLTEIPADLIAGCKKPPYFGHDDIPVAAKPAPLPKSEIRLPPTLRFRRDSYPEITAKVRQARQEATVTVTKAEHAELMKNKAKTDPKPQQSSGKVLMPPLHPYPRPTTATIQITAAEHAELMNSKAKTDELAKAVADQAKALEDMKNQLHDLNSRSVIAKPEVTPEERALFVKADSFESKCAVVLQETRATTVNVLLEQANVLVPQNLAQNQAIVNKIQDLIWGVRNAEERAANAEEIARMAIAELRNFKAETEQNIKFLSEKMTENEEFLYDAIVRINKLGRGFTVLSAEIGKNNQYATICNALNEGKHHGAAAFIIAFVSKFTGEHTFATLAANKKFKFDYGMYGMVSDSLVAIANLVPVAGVGAFATMVQMTVKTFEDKRKVANANKIVNTTGRIIGGPEELATRIAVSILQLNGHIIAKCPHDVAHSIANLCFDATIKYITATPKDQLEISAEEIAYALMNGKFLDQQSAYRGYVLSFDSVGNVLTTRANPDNPTKAREWLSDTLMQYGNNPERFDDVLALPATRSVGSRVSVTPRFNSSKIDEQKVLGSVSPAQNQQRRFEMS